MRSKGNVQYRGRLMLQRGRARAGAEWLRNFRPVKDAAAVLQRGRARAGAECVTCASQCSYHGQASTGPRPRGRGMLPARVDVDVPVTLLQRGRARAGAEWFHFFRHTLGGFGASTGPRPRGRGMREDRE